MNGISLSDGEWKLMNALWQNAPCTLSQLVGLLENDTGWTKSTIFVMLKRLSSKGAVEINCEGKLQLYSPLILREDATIKETESFLSRVYGGSIGLMISSMAGQKALSEKDIADLRKILEDAGKENSDD